jgi:hypothetical protein
MSLSFFENCADYDIMGKEIAEVDRSQMTVWCMQDTKGHKHTLGICTTFCSSTATMVA